MQNPRTPADLAGSRSPLIPKGLRVETCKARIEDGRIVWEHIGGLAAGQFLKVSDFTLLQEFTGLGNADDAQLLRFAQKYGPLHLCKHGFAFGHRERDFNLRCYASDIEEEDLTRGTCARESVEGWRRYIRRAKGILTVATKLRDGRRASTNDWSWILDGIPSANAEDPLASLLTLRKEDALAANPLLAVLAAQPRRTLPEQRQVLALAVNHWLDECEIGVSIEWPQSGIDFRIGRSDPFGLGSSLLIAIGVQLLRAVLRQESFVWCSTCGYPYPPKRWPRAGEMHYCQRCGRAAALRNAQRKFREKRNSAPGQKEQTE